MFQFYRDLNRKSNQVKNCRAKIELLGSYDPQKQLIIEDPYYVSVVSLPSWCSQTRAMYREPAWVPAVGGQRQAPWRRVPEWFVTLPPPCPPRATTPTLRPSTSSACGAAGLSWRRLADRPSRCGPGSSPPVCPVPTASPFPSQGRSPLFSWLTVSYLKK